MYSVAKNAEQFDNIEVIFSTFNIKWFKQRKKICLEIWKFFYFLVYGLEHFTFSEILGGSGLIVFCASFCLSTKSYWDNSFWVRKYKETQCVIFSQASFVSPH